MNTNEMILLLDIHRGTSDMKHPDYQHMISDLARQGYIEPDMDGNLHTKYVLTAKGTAMVEALKSVGLKLVWETVVRP